MEAINNCISISSSETDNQRNDRATYVSTMAKLGRALMAAAARRRGRFLHCGPCVRPALYRAASSLAGGSGVAVAKAENEPVLAVSSPEYALYPNDVHCFLGLNGSGKSRFLQLAQRTGPTAPQYRVAALSLDAHRAFVAKNGKRIVADVLGGVASPKARDLIVRLGLFPVWESRVSHLSTGELRKLLLAVALLETPRATVLVLDQPFDGLDVAARRQLEWMLGQLTRGFTRLLVETGFGRNEAFAYRTQVLLVANRLEQVFPDILSHVVLLKSPPNEADGAAATTAREPVGLPAELDVVEWPHEDESSTMLARLKSFLARENDRRPQMDDIEMASLISQLFGVDSKADDDVSEHPLAVRLDGVSIAYDTKRTLLERVDFARKRHEHWVLLGPNGSGKSSLMRVLMQTPGHGLTEGQVGVAGQTVAADRKDSSRSERVEAISTDQHIQLLQQSLDLEGSRDGQISALDLIVENARGDIEKAEVAAKLLRVPPSVYARPLSQLSQGEQKLVLIARALAASPEMLILDEITHGLDPFNRAHVLRVVDAVGKVAARKTHLILITHHEDEITECFESVFEIQDKQLVEREQAA